MNHLSRTALIMLCGCSFPGEVAISHNLRVVPQNTVWVTNIVWVTNCGPPAGTWAIPIIWVAATNKVN